MGFKLGERAGQTKTRIFFIWKHFFTLRESPHYLVEKSNIQQVNLY